jgi:hypothetical protein
MNSSSSPIADIVGQSPVLVPAALSAIVVAFGVLMLIVHRLVATKYHVRIRWKGGSVELEPHGRLPPAGGTRAE